MSHVELFTSVLGCTRCPTSCVLRDASDNVPQPGWIGRNYRGGILFIGQNPGVRKDRTATADIKYIGALKQVRDGATLQRLLDVMHESMQVFAMYKQYIPSEFFDEVAIVNAVRCRTVGDGAPNEVALQNCKQHLSTWLDVLQPAGVVFNGVWAANNVGSLVARRKLPTVTINRQRSLPADARQEQAARVRALVESARALS